MADENEEFEFRLRAESEGGGKAARALPSLKDPLAPAKIGEGVLSMATGAIASAAGGLAGAAGTILPGDEGQGARYVKKVQDALTYQPRSDIGKAVVEGVGKVVEPIGKVAEFLGTKSAEATDSPLVGTVVDTAVQTLGPPGVGAAAGGVKSAAQAGARSLMQGAIKPTIKDLKSGKATQAVQTLLDEGISPTKGGMEKLRGLVDDLNDQIKGAISGSSATVDVQNVGRHLQPVFDRFAKQVNATGDLTAIRSAWDEFVNHPAIGGSARIPVKMAQEMKQGTYRALDGKFGEVGSAATEAQKALARGLKDEVAQAVPGVAGLNARESMLINALKVGERRALMEANKNPMGLSLLANNPAAWAAFMADRSAAFKALAARMINRSSQVLPTAREGAIAGAGAVAATE